MALDYEFSPIDVGIATHPKAFKAGVAAMGLWLWGQTHAKYQRTGGRLTRDAVFGAWGGGERLNSTLAKRLVAAGLWIAREDGDWDIFNFEAKGPGERKASKSSSAERMARKRERDAAAARDAACDTVPSSQSDASQVTVTSTSVSSSVSVSSPDPDLASPPDWWDGACDAAAMAAVGTVGERPARWVAYLASRRRKGWAMNHTDAVGWISEVVRGERDRQSSRPGPRGGPVQSGEKRCWIVPAELEM